MYEPGAPTRSFSSSLTRDLLVSVLIGVCITLVVHFPSGVLPPLQQWIVAVVISLSIYATARVLFRLLSPWVKRSGVRQKVLVAGIMVVAGPLGYVLGGTTEMFVRTGTVEVPWRSLLLPLLVVAGICIVIGLTLHTFDRQSERLAENVARLKEAEFAERELHLARGLQSRLLPPPEIEGEGYRIAARNLPARVVAGDFYDVFPLAGGALGVVVADVAGKGMAASLIMASVKAMLPLVAAGRTPEETLRELNRRLAAELSPREFVALAYARFDPADGTVALANAGLPDPYLLPLSGSAQPVAVPGPRLPLGVRREVEYRSQGLSLASGERLLFLTDGLAEAPTAAGEPLGYAAFAELVEGARSPVPSGWLDDLLDRVRSATTPGLEDDWTALVLERVERAAER
ncbi:MAG TPA: PP2C family protein-serine/threonine phosphatase [Thermoanaerobaculia bacterium]|nr:PP2C family protein-serine/threonine phosphatase [Thermoanaerobaculia bacterium]